MAVHISSEDFNSIPLLGLVLEQLSSSPSTPATGRVYYDTVLGYPRINVGTSGTPSWIPLALAAGIIVDSMISASAAISNSKLATNPLARANHTGTQLAATISDFAAAVELIRLDQLAAPTSALQGNGQKASNWADPTSAQDLATFAWVQSQIQTYLNGQDWKNSVRAASTGNLTLSGTQTVDGVALIAGDRILVKNQTTGANNGIYVVASGAWTRATDADNSPAGEVTSGMTVPVEEGTALAGTVFLLSTPNAIVLGTTALTFTQIGAAGTSYVAGTGLTLTGNSFALTTPVSAANGGTGVSSLAALKTALGVPGVFSAAIPAISAGATGTLTHNLGTTSIMVSILPASGGVVTADAAAIDLDWAAHDANTVLLGPPAAAISSGAYRVVVVG